MGWMELLVVGVVALIVVGPKDLPVMFQALGKMTAKVKRMAREFQTAMNDAANATGAADISKDLKGLTSPKSLTVGFHDYGDLRSDTVRGRETGAQLRGPRGPLARRLNDNSIMLAI